MVQTYEVGKYQVSDYTAALLEAWFSAVKCNYEDFDEFVRSALRKEVGLLIDRPDFTNHVLDYLKNAGHTVEIKIPTKLYDRLEAEAKDKGITVERLVEKTVETMNSRPNVSVI